MAPRLYSGGPDGDGPSRNQISESGHHLKNSLSLILYTLQDAVAANPGAKTWGPATDIIEEQGAGPDGQVWWVSASSKNLLSQADLQELSSGGYLTTALGSPESKRLGRNTRKAYGIRVAKLRKGAQALERTATHVQILTQKNKELERELRIARETNGAAFDLNNFLEQLRTSFKVKNTTPTFDFKRTKPRKVKANAGVPTLMVSDWHWGEVVQPERVDHLNEYNIGIAKDRARRTFETTMEVLFHHQSGMNYEAMVLSMAGDMFSGNIHDELRATNERPIHDCLLDLTETLSSAIVQMADNFPGIYVPCVAGNHGRIDLKPTSKNAPVDNYDYLLYKMVELQVKAKMGNKCNVDFDIAGALDLKYSVYNTRYLLTHGDQINSSTNSDDFWASMMKMAARKQERSARGMNGGFDYMTVGHFHKYGTVSNVIVNGSLKGYCEWVYKKNYSFDRPIQALWVTHPDHKITSHVPIYGDEPFLDGSHNLPPITSSTGMRNKR